MQELEVMPVRLSTRPETVVVDHPQGVNGKVNKASNGNLFYVLPFIMDGDGFNVVEKSTYIWADNNGNFALSADEFNNRVQARIAKAAKLNQPSPYQGELVTIDLPEYSLTGTDGVKRTYTSAKLLKLVGQTDAQVATAFMKRNGTAPVTKQVPEKANANIPPTTAEVE